MRRAVGRADMASRRLMLEKIAELEREVAAESAKDSLAPVEVGDAQEKTGKVVLVGGEWFYRKPNDALRYGPYRSASEAAEAAREAGVAVDQRGAAPVEVGDAPNIGQRSTCAKCGGPIEYARTAAGVNWMHSKESDRGLCSGAVPKSAPSKDRLHRALDAVLDARDARRRRVGDGERFYVKQNRNKDAWGVFEEGDDFPIGGWFASKARATEELRRRKGTAAKPAKKTEAQQPDIFGYPWEYIQGLQQGKSRASLEHLLRKKK